MSLDRLAAALGEKECALVSSAVSRQYLSGFRSSDGTLLVLKEKSYLFLDSRYFEMACIAQRAGKIPSSIEICSMRFPDFLAEQGKNGAVRRILFEDRHVTVSTLQRLEKDYGTFEFVPMKDMVDRMRLVKREEEIRGIATSQKLAEAAFQYILPRLEAGRTELEVAAELEYFMKKNGASAPSFSTICVSGSRSSLPHGTPTHAPLEKNSFLTMDFGCMLDGYASDMTRTVCIGRADEEMKKVYDTVLQAQTLALAAIRAGVTGKEVDSAARDHIALAGYGDCFGHSTGHGIGLEVHEAPAFSPSYEGEIPAGAVLSVEPGIYLEGRFGVRIEDLAVVREKGHDNLNSAPKHLLEL